MSKVETFASVFVWYIYENRVSSMYPIYSLIKKHVLQTSLQNSHQHFSKFMYSISKLMFAILIPHGTIKSN